MRRVFIFRQKNLRAMLLLVALSAACMSALAVGVRSHSSAPVSPPPASPVASDGGERPQSGEVELITLRPSGFEPRQLTRPLFHEAGTRLREVRVARARRHYREALDLAPGKYV